MVGCLLAAVAVLVPLGLVWWFWCGPSTTLVLIRHADRDGQLDALNAAGRRVHRSWRTWA